MKHRPVLAVLVLGLLSLVGCTQVATSVPRDAVAQDAAPVEPGRPARPVPTFHAPPVDPTRVVDTGLDYKARRKDYVRQMHRAPPDVDWQALEAANGAAQREKRNVLAGLAAGSSRWTERGSNNLAGRMHVAVPAPDGTHLYAGSSKGGVWRGTRDGQDWTPLGDNLDGGAHWLAVVPGVQPADPDIIVRATDGGQIHRSTDSGATWLPPAGLPAASSVRRMLTLSDGSHRLYVVLHKSGTANSQVWRSTDRGASFTQVAGAANYDADLWAPRTGGSDLYLLRGSDCWRSTDGGDSWMQLGSLPASGSAAEIAGSEAGAPRLWVVQSEGGTQRLYRSDDAGGSWSLVTTVSDYWGSLNASSIDPDLFAWGGVEVHRTANAGSSFAIVNAWWEYYGNEADRLHADIPGIDVVPDGGGETWYVSTDGGLYESTDGLASVSNLSLTGLRVSQYYSTLTSTTNPDHVAAGSQDQGYQRADSPPLLPDTTLAFEQLISGDYGHLTSSDGSHAWLYSVYPGFVLIHRKENDPDLYTADFPADDHQWMPYIVADPIDERSFFFCGSKLWRHTKSPLLFEWNPVQWSAQNFAASGGEVLTAVTFSPVDSQRAFAATSHGRLFRSLDRGVTWNLASTSGPPPHYFYGTALVASGLTVDVVYAGGSGYGNPAVWRSTDGGQSFQSWSTGLPSTLVYSLVEAPDGSGTLFAGTETAAYKRAPGDGAWIDITGAEAPVNTYWSVEAVPALDIVRFGTYGRGIWDYSLEDPCAYEPFGVGLGGTNTLTLDTSSSTVIGQDHVFTVTGGPPGALGYLIVSAASTSLPLYGGTLLVDPDYWILLPAIADGSGGFTFPVGVPPDGNLVGLEASWQAALRTSVVPEAWAFSNGVVGTLCEP